MHKTSLVRKNILCTFLFLANLFLGSCSSNDRSGSEEFLKKLLLEEGGVYTLLGDKPITDVLVYLGSEHDISLEGLSDESLQKVEYINDHTLENWNSWKTFAKDLKLTNFRFVERPCLRDPLHMIYLFVNVEKLRDLLQQHSPLFATELGMHFEIERVIGELDDPESTFWNGAFSNHCLSGLLHGYGEENSRHFLDIVKDETPPHFSEKFEGPITQDHFPLPTFATSSNDAVVEKYRQQRKTIQEVYKKRDFFRTTMKLLQT